MIRTVIVDDEVLATVGLKAMIDWPSQGFEIVGEADNGESGWEVIRRLRPDLVITDIKMPRLDGLEMMQRVLAEQPAVRFVVLSGYNDFPLVKKALQQGARDYILKLTLQKETLMETLENLKREILPETGVLMGKTGETQIADGAPAMSGQEIRREMRRAFGGNGDSGRLHTILNSLGFGPPDETDLRVALVQVLPGIGSVEADGSTISVKSVLVDMIGKLAADFGPAYSFHWEGNRYLLLVATGRTPVLSETEKELNAIGSSLIRLLKQYVNMDAAVGFSDTCDRTDALHIALAQAERAADRSFYDDYGQVYLFDSTDGEEGIAPSDSQDSKELVERAMETSTAGLIRQGLERVLARIRMQRPMRSEALTEIHQLLAQIDLRTSSEWQSAPEQQSAELYAKLFALPTFDSLTGFLHGYLEVISDRMNRLRHKNNQVIVNKAQKFVAENISRRITLRETANRLHVSAGYLSTLFPRVTHMKFTDYVNQAKIKEAQDMLHSGRYKVFEISDALNFQTPSYFTKIFKKHTGCSPSEYARRAELEEQA